MIRRDMPEALEIEREAFQYPWEEEEFITALRQRNCIAMVAEVDDQVAAYMVYELHKTRIHLLNFAVWRDLRRRGIGTALVGKLKGKLAAQRRTKITLEVRETNLAAQLFWRAQNFRAVKVLRDFYDDTTEDAYEMQYRLVPAAELLPVNRIGYLLDDR
jgi:ribosomal-protein-alanine N-acetyltransferase